MSESAQEDRTEAATAKRLDEARKKGQVARSPELSAAAVLLASGAGLYAMAAPLASALAGLMNSSLKFKPQMIADESAAISLFQASMLSALLATAPVLALTMLAAFAAPLVVGGWNFSAEALGVRLDRISPLNGFKRMFSLRSGVELGKSLAKFAVVAIAAWLVLASQAEQILHLSREPVQEGMRHAALLAGQALLATSAAIALIAAVDVPYQLWQHAQELRMTKEEVRQESRESEGSPEIKGRIRAAQQALARRRMMEEVPKADVVVTNPTHYSVALRYDETRMRAPRVIAKGADEVAARIRELADLHGVPRVEAPPLARVLYRVVDIGAEVPGALYVAVAQILTYVYQLKAAHAFSAVVPVAPVIDPSVEHIGRRGAH